ncbi:probable serine/threonine-protein kinase At1g54610 isoform X1 [Zingiber officinale]|uniref:probable serine/threonine-protein kinase At1g54610 isoform X1 n=1 Tax=Zingiber officinale TaxID=94328 RepID=UPI001C4CAB6B|nr:probable serine/threonine-protein kinase At1g54610 isoform X1 [Zingiber officinale]
MGCFLGKFTVGDVSHPVAATAAAETPAASRATAEKNPDSLVTHLPADPTPAPPRRLFVSYSPGDSPAWPAWLSAAAGDALDGWPPRSADSFQKIEKIGSGTYSNVYKARDLVTGRVVALKKVRVESVDSAESVGFMVREIVLLRRLDHPNVIRLEGLAVSRVPTSPSLYLIFDYMEHDLAGLTALPGFSFSESQVKFYMEQLFSGLEHCHSRGVLHRDLKCSNLLLTKEGILKIADFGLAISYDHNKVKPMTNRVVTLWYRPPELLLGATHYGFGVDLWSAGCILAELLTGKPILPARTEVEQLHRIFKLCGTPSEGYFERLNLQQKSSFRSYERCLWETFSDLSPSAVALLDKLLSLDPLERGTATSVLNSDFFKTKPYACGPSSLQQYPPSKEMDMHQRKSRHKRQQNINTKDGKSKYRIQLHDKKYRGPGAPIAIAKVQAELDRLRWMASASAIKITEKFPPPHLDGAIGITMDSSYDESFVSMDESFTSARVAPSKNAGNMHITSADRTSSLRKMNGSRKNHKMAPPGFLLGAFTPYLLSNFRKRT